MHSLEERLRKLMILYDLLKDSISFKQKYILYKKIKKYNDIINVARSTN